MDFNDSAGLPASTIPAHVPPSLVRQYDWMDMQGETETAAHFLKMDALPDVFWTPYYGGHWVATRYKEMEYIYTHAGEFSSRHATLPVSPFQIPLQEYDGEAHRLFRGIVQPFFTPKHIFDLEKTARKLTIDLIDGFYARGHCEFISEFAQQMPIVILMSLLGLPAEDRDYLMPLSESITRFEKYEDKIAGLMKIAQYTGEKIIPARRAKPGPDIFSAVLAAQAGGAPITDQEIMGLGALLIAAGLDTVASMLGFITAHLAQHPEQRRELVENPALITEAMEEMLRRYSLANMCRQVTKDMEFGGAPLKAGDLMLVPLSRAGLDPAKYDHPEVVDFHRASKINITFGRGAHQCIGAFLARTELRVFLQEWLQRIPEFEIKPGFEVKAKVGSANALHALEIVWKPV
jgi:cytochrome P450